LWLCSRTSPAAFLVLVARRCPSPLAEACLESWVRDFGGFGVLSPKYLRSGGTASESGQRIAGWGRSNPLVCLGFRDLPFVFGRLRVRRNGLYRTWDALGLQPVGNDPRAVEIGSTL